MEEVGLMMENGLSMLCGKGAGNGIGTLYSILYNIQH